MKKTFRYILSALLIAGGMAACSPDTFEGVNESGIPTASAYADLVNISVDQELNQVTFTLNQAQGVYPIWTIELGNGKTERKTVNGYRRIFTSAGDYTVRMKVGSRDGISDGEVVKTFHINNTIMSFDKYIAMLSKNPWYMDNTVAGHLACGPSAEDPTSWWSGEPNCKDGTGLYDNCLTFTSEMGYHFEPGDNGTMYVNYGTAALNTTGATEDFSLPVEAMDATYGFEVDGDDLYLTFPAHTYFPYIANEDIWETPRYKVINMTTKQMTLVSSNGSIGWQYILSTSHEVAFSGFKYNAESNLWLPIDQQNDYTTHYYYAPGWSQLPDPAYVHDGSTWSISLPSATTDQWQAQAAIKPTNLTLSTDLTYDFSCTLNSTTDINGVTIKLTDVNSGDNYVFVERVDLKAFEDYVFYLSDVNALKETAACELFFDFGGNPDNTEVTISKIVVKDHAIDDGTVLPDEEPEEPGEQIVWIDNLLQGMPVDISYYYAPGWSQLPDPAATISGTTYTVELPSATSDQWQGQFTFNNIGVQIDHQKQYDFRVKVLSTTDHPGITVKLTQQDNDDLYLTADRHAVSAFEETWIELGPLTLNKEEDITNLKIVYDFGGNADGTTITLSDMQLQEHNASGGKQGVDWDLTGPGNLWLKGAHETLSFYYAPGWAQIADPQTVVDGNSYTISLPSATSDQWQAQWHISTDLGKADISADKAYDIRFTIYSTTDQPGITVKFTENGNDDNYLTADRHPAVAYEEQTVELIGLTLSKGDITNETFKMVFDFGGCPDGSEVTIKDIIIQEHSESAGGGGGSAATWDYNSASNLWRAVDEGSAFLSVTPWFADGGWSQVADPVWSHSGSAWELDIVHESNSQWQAQFPINTTLTASMAEKYDLAVTLEADNNISGVTVKLTETDDAEKHDNNFFTADRHDVEAYEPLTITYTGLQLPLNDAHALSFFFDFGGCPAGTHVKISDIIFRKSE